jgi:hypothetical protein
MPFKTTNIGGVLQSQYEQDPRLLMALQGMQQGGSTAPVQSGYEGIARALQGPINAYMAKQLRGEYEDKQADQYGKIADILAPGAFTAAPGPKQATSLPGVGDIDTSTPQISETPNPNRDAIIAAMQSGVVKPDAFSTAIADKLGFGKASEYDPTPRYDQNGNAYLVGKDGTTKPLTGVKARDKMEIAGNGQPYNPYAVQPTQNFSSKDKPFDSATGAPNQAVQDFELSKAKTSRPQMSVNVSADRSFGTQLGENAGKILDASHSAAAGGIQTINTVSQIKDALATGKVTAGPGASAVQFFNQVAGGDPEKVAATRKTIQGLAQLTMAGRSALKGQGQISDYEGKLLAKASSGDIDSMTVGEIATIAEVADRNARISIRLNKSNVDKARKAAPGNQDLVDFYNVDEPPAYAPAPKKSGRFTIEQQ